MIRKRENIVARVIHDSYFLIDIKQNYLDDKQEFMKLMKLDIIFGSNLMWSAM